MCDIVFMIIVFTKIFEPVDNLICIPVNFDTESKIAYADEGVYIPEGKTHNVDSEADTWGLSIGVV